MQKKIDMKKEYICEKCGKKFYWDGELVAHRWKEHKSEVKLEECDTECCDI